MHWIKKVLSLEWVVLVVRFMTRTAGNVAESVFTIASLWVIINMVAHKLTLGMLGKENVATLNQIALIAFSALPELIFVTVLGHTLSLYREGLKLWAILYTVPCLCFVFLTINAFCLFTNSNGDVSIVLTGPDMIFRVLTGWYYAVLNTMYHQLKQPDLLSENKRLVAENSVLITEISDLKNKPRKASRATSQREIKPSNWLVEHIKSGNKTVELDRLIEEIGVSKRELNREIKAGNLELDRRSPTKIRTKSLAEWLEIPLVEI